jgi:Na+:H+ antiporter
MQDELFIRSIIYFVFLLFIASVSAIFFKRVRFPYTIGLVIIGIILNYLSTVIPVLEPIRNIRLTPDVILYILLPTLIFGASFTIDSRLLVKNLAPVMMLAAPGLVIATLVTGVLVAWFTPLSLSAAMLFGALISATDPVAVVALFGEIGAPKRLNILVDGESLFNDATAIVVFRIIFGMIASGTTWGIASLMKGSVDFCTVFFGGLLVGGVIGYIVVKITSIAKDDPLIQIALSTVAAYVAFILADYYLKVSGVMSAMGAGIVLSWFGLTRYTPEVKQYMTQFWEYAGFVGNSFIFLLLGLTEAHLLVDLIRMPGLIVNIAIVVAVVTFARALVVYGLCPLVGKLRHSDSIGIPYQTVIFWGGLRGAVPLALAFSLASDFEHRRLIVELTLGVVLFTLLVQGTTISWLMRLLKLNKQTLFERITKLQTIVDSKIHGLRQIEEMKHEHKFNKNIIETFEKDYKIDLEKAYQKLHDVLKEPTCSQSVIRQTLWTQALFVSKRVYSNLFERKVISESVFRELVAINAIAVDSVSQGNIPELSISPVPLEKQILKFVTTILMKFCPDMRFTKKIRMANFEIQYEIVTAIVIASYHIAILLNDLKKLHDVHTDVFTDCDKLFEKRNTAALRRLKGMSKEFPNFFDELQVHSIKRITRTAEMEAIEALMRHGGIPKSLGCVLVDEINDELINDHPAKLNS